MDATEMMKGMKPEDLKALLKNKISESMHQNASPYTQKRINALKNLQVSMLKVEAQFYDELHELELKYAKAYEPLNEKRRTIVSGEYEPTEEEAKWALDEDTEENGDEKALENGTEEEKGVKNFWLETLQSFRITSEIIQEYDEEILGYLRDIKVKLFEAKPYGYTLEFYFNENPYFSNTVLTKTYVLKTEVDPKDPFSYDGPDLEKATGCQIEWKEGKNVCMKMVKKKIKPKNKKQPPKVVTKEEKQDSFFNFFDTPKVPAKNELAKTERDDEDDDEQHDQELYLIADFEIGQYLKEKIIPKAILFYTGEGVDDEFEEDDYDEDEDDEGEDDEDEDGEDEDDEEDDDDDDEEEDEDAPKKGKKNKKGSKPKNGEPTPSECKQN